MGMFDSAYIEVRCPRCGKMEERECQTKDTDCFLEVWKPGDFVSDQFKWINAITDCTCPDGHNNYFRVKIFLDEKGNLTENYQIIEDK